MQSVSDRKKDIHKPKVLTESSLPPPMQLGTSAIRPVEPVDLKSEKIIEGQIPDPAPAPDQTKVSASSRK